MIYVKLSDIIYRCLILPSGSDEKYRDVYLYLCETFISTFINLFIIILVSLVLGKTTEMLCFFITFIPLRLFGHGAHASTHSRCLALFLIIMLSSITFASFLVETSFYLPIILIGLICCFFLQYRYSTDKQGNRRYQYQKLYQFAFPWTICLLVCVLLFLSFKPRYTVISAFGIYVQSISLILKKESENHEKDQVQISSNEI